MQYRIAVDAPCDVDAVGDAMLGADPAAIVDADPVDGALRVSTCLDAAEIIPVLGTAGLSVSPQQVVRLPSECCGGCGG